VKRIRRAHLALAAGVLVLALAAGAPSQRASAQDADSTLVPAGLGVPAIPVANVDGIPMVGANDLARLLRASRSWRADVRKLVLRVGTHRLTLTADNPFVIVDDRTLRLEHEVRSRGGELHIPVELAELLPVEAGWPRVTYDAGVRQLRTQPSEGLIGDLAIEVRGGRTWLVIPCERPDAALVAGRSRARFRLRLAGALVGALPDSLPEYGLVRDLTVARAPGGVTLELALDPATLGFRLDPDPARARVVVSFTMFPEAGDERFASEGPPGRRVVRTIVLDPGHGGSDPGVRVEGAEEKSLMLELAVRLADELQRRLRAKVLLTRRDDRDLSQEARAEAANRSRADLVLSLHVGAFPSPRARGVLAWCAPATRTAGDEAQARAAGLVTLLPWRDVALDRAVESRELAENVTSSLERAGFGPVRVHERLPLALVGVQSPGILLECGSLSHPEDRARLLSQAGIRDLARAIADGVLAWQGV